MALGAPQKRPWWTTKKSAPPSAACSKVLRLESTATATFRTSSAPSTCKPLSEGSLYAFMSK